MTLPTELPSTPDTPHHVSISCPISVAHTSSGISSKFADTFPGGRAQAQDIHVEVEAQKSGLVKELSILPNATRRTGYSHIPHITSSNYTSPVTESFVLELIQDDNQLHVL